MAQQKVAVPVAACGPDSEPLAVCHNVLSIAIEVRLSVCHICETCKNDDSYSRLYGLIRELNSSSFRKTKVGHWGSPLRVLIFGVNGNCVWAIMFVKNRISRLTG